MKYTDCRNKLVERDTESFKTAEKKGVRKQLQQEITLLQNKADNHNGLGNVKNGPEKIPYIAVQTRVQGTKNRGSSKMHWIDKVKNDIEQF